MSKSNIGALQDLIQIARDSKAFYESAISKVKDPTTKAVYERMATAKGDLINKLSALVSSRGETPATGDTLVGNLRQAYADLRAAMSRNDDAIYTAQLEETEDRLLKYFDQTLAQTSSMEIRAVLEAQLPQVHACHNAMRNLKTSLAA